MTINVPASPACDAWPRDAQQRERLGVLAGGIAHDFNNLLVGILGNASLLRMKLGAESGFRALVESIERSAERAAQLVREMMAYAGNGDFQYAPVCLRTLVEDAACDTARSAAASVQLILDLPGDLPRVRCDEAHMRLAVQNVTANALEALGDENGRIVVRVRRVRRGELDIGGHAVGGVEPGPYVSIEVSDDGCGMGVATQAKMFDPFFTSKLSGRGLGLSAVLGIARGHGGTVEVESRLGTGTTVRILVPERRVPEGEATERDGATHLPEAATVLVVDDEEAVREVARAVLDDSGLGVLTAEDGQEGLEVLRRNRAEIDLVLLDMSMPRMGGAEAFRRMRQLVPELPIILTSGYRGADVGEPLGDDESALFLPKPYTPGRLLQTVRRAMAG